MKPPAPFNWPQAWNAAGIGVLLSHILFSFTDPALTPADSSPAFLCFAIAILHRIESNVRPKEPTP